MNEREIKINKMLENFFLTKSVEISSIKI